MADCLFCSIVAGDVPADIVRTDERTVAFRDINPQAPVHVLVVPRRHIVDASTVDGGDGDEVTALLTAAREVARGRGHRRRGPRLPAGVQCGSRRPELRAPPAPARAGRAGHGLATGLNARRASGSEAVGSSAPVRW